MAGRSPLHNTLFSVAGQVVGRLLALALYAVLARHFGPDLYGDMGLGASFGVIFAVIVEPGLNPLLIKDGATAPAELPQRFAETLAFKLLTIALVWPVMVGAGWLMGLRGSAIWAVVFAGGTALLVGLEDLGSAVLTARERMDLEASLRSISKLMFAGVGLLAVALHASFAAILAVLTGAQAATGVAMVVLVRRSGLPVRLSPQLQRTWAQVTRAWPLAVTGVLWLVTLRLDQILATMMGVPRADLGDYNAAVKLVEALILFPTAIALTFSPLLARAFVEGPQRAAEELSVGLETALSVCLPVAVGGALLAGPIATFVYGGSFSGTGPLLCLQVLGLPLIGIQFLSMYALIGAGELRSQTLIVVVNLSLNVAGNLVLVPRLGILGATLAALTGTVGGAIASLALVRRHGMKPALGGASWRPLAASAVMGAAVWALREHLPFWANIIAGAIVYGGVYYVLGGTRLVVALRTRRERRLEPAIQA
ncbi:MAG: flippase [Deltaproteobacteria bacterium]|nr:flippase [Deltaproteobacteria bacterium]